MISLSQFEEPQLWGFLSGVKPPERLALSDLAAKEVYLSGSQYGARYDPAVVPAHAFVLDAFKNTRIKEIANVAPTGFGKTTIFEVCASYAVAQDPGDLLMLGQNDKLVKDWMESRLLKVLRRSPWTRDFIPTGKDRNDAKKSSIIFRHMAMFTGGANFSNTQEKSMRYCFGDEVWRWIHGVIGEFLKRHHNRLNRKMLLQSQGGNEKTEWHEFCRNGKWHVGHHQCPECKEFSPVVMENMIYGDADLETGKRSIQRDSSGEYDWPRIFESVRYVCPCCQTEFEDTDQNRRQWAICKPVWNGNNHFPDRVTFSWTFMTGWAKTWCEIVKLWIMAIDQKKMGNLEPLKQFINKDLGQFWEEPSDAPTIHTGGKDSYRKAAHNQGEVWEGECARHMRIDVQKGHFWCSIRAWKNDDGVRSRLLWEGKIDTWQGLFELQERYALENRDVWIDGRYGIDEVARQIYMHCGAPKYDSAKKRWDFSNQWNILIGQDNAKGYQYDVGTPKRPRKVWKIYSKWQYGVTQRGQQYCTISFSNLRAKDALAGMMSVSTDGEFGVPEDASINYREHMQSEVKREPQPGVYRWEKIKEHVRNDLWDTEVQGMVACAIRGIMKLETSD